MSLIPNIGEKKSKSNQNQIVHKKLNKEEKPQSSHQSGWLDVRLCTCNRTLALNSSNTSV